MEIIQSLYKTGQSIDVDPHNRRIKIYRYPTNQEPKVMIASLKKLGKEKNCDKLIFYIMKEERYVLGAEECYLEGILDGFFKGRDAYIYSIFLKPERNHSLFAEKQQSIMETVIKDRKSINSMSLKSEYLLREAEEKDIEAMAELYDTVFITYPTMMNDPEFIKKMMKKNTLFTVIEHKGTIVSACSADLFPAFEAAEMTDCVTLPEHRGSGLLSNQFHYLIEKMRKNNVKTLFSYSRAVLLGMNLINARHGFDYRGRMKQNSNISGRLECMNVWVKRLNY
ncbi:putative beta-lysine N-acetyltransferase [Bacillus taeanensis]|uniref:Putative beta-lysine N-acetyltransferase n=1 Tax=Bacillus taeanensis TaxID=273032 RepID=A0A366Y398_9BACI|nr:putative beta-lysine N-acetyltransferase [Bacillus taeanensis]RBW70671.1 putative beta-lysine N-acetyltransferase [Bacillus taeanensis]